MFLLWYDDSKKTVETKIHAAIAAYHDRFHVAPTVVLTNAAEQVAIAGVLVRSEAYIRPNNYWIGREEST